MTEIEYKQVKTALKQILKSRKLTYQDVAEKTNTSEITIKRFFADDNYSAKLFKICEQLDISLFDLVELAKGGERQHFELTDKQDKFFTSNIGHFAIFRELYRGHSVKAIKARWELTQQEMFKVLMDLEKIDLIEVHAKDKVRIIPQGVMELKKNSKLELTLRDKLTTPFIKKFDELNFSDEFYHNSEIEMGEDTQKALRQEMEELIKRYCTLALRDKTLLDPSKISSVRWLFCFAKYQTPWEKFKPSV
jgi:transcriptional regulator with XRE-family HTH domain